MSAQSMVGVRSKRGLSLAAAVAAALSSASVFGGTSTNTAGPVQQGQSDGGSGNPSLNNPAVTISFSGQTALRAFDTTPGITELAPGTSIVLHDGTGGAPVTYISPGPANNSSTFVQLANPNFTSQDTNPGTPSSPSTNSLQIASAVRLEWHEQGSVDGFYDLINDEVGYAGGSPTNPGTPISVEAQRTPSSSNPTWINTNQFTAGGTKNGFALDNSASDILAQTYNPAVYNQTTGVNIQGGQNRIQFSVGEYPTEVFSTAGTPSPFASFSGAGAAPAGYGQGNPALRQASTLTGLGVGGTRQTFQPTSIVNESTSINDPQTDSAYAAGPWNTAGTNNVTSTSIGVTAVTYSANPGTGLERINKGDSQWLQTTGRLQNGALFNVVARTVDTGQRVVFALNTGVDPSWAVGSNDDGNSTSSAAATAQHSIGTSLRYDGKTSGSEAEKTIAQSRMSVGALSVPEARAATNTAPVRALDVDFNDQTDPTSGGSTDDSKFIRANFNSIVSNGSSDANPNFGGSVQRYNAVLISHYNTIKTPNVAALNAELANLYGAGSNTSNTTAAQQQTAWANVQSFDPSTAETDGTPSFPVSGIKGDTTGDVAAFISNIANSTGSAASGLVPSTVNNPADSLFINGFLIPQLLDWSRVTDGGPISAQTPNYTQQQEVNSNYGSLFTTDGTFGSNNQTIGSGATYGAGGSQSAFNGNIPITAKDAAGNAVGNGVVAPGGNYLFGNFNQNGVRDLSAVEQSVNAALSLTQLDVVGHGGTDSSFTSGGGVTNGTVVASLDNTGGTPGWVTTSTNTKGDLVVLGDFNGDGKFDGQDLYLLAIGASLTSASSTTGLNATAATFSDVLRDPTNVLRKNTALNYVNTYLTTGFGATNYPAAAAYLKKSGAAVLTGTSSGNTDLVDTHTVNPVTGTENYIPSGATDLGTQDPITGLEQYTFDPAGNNAFNASDVNRDGDVDFNDAALVDQYNGQSYTNLTQSLAATAQTPVTGAIEAISLVAVQQVDGEAAIGSADLAIENSALTGTGNTNWYSYTLKKSGPGTITWARTGGTVTVYNGATFDISGGTVQIGGTTDPFSDNNATGTTVGNHLAVQVDHGAKLQLTQHQATFSVAGLTIDTGSNSVVDVGDNALIIHGDATVEASIAGYLASGYAGGAWNGPGIDTSAPLVVGGASYGLGYAGSSDPGNPAGLSAGTIEVKYTLLGDADLNGIVNGIDFGIVAANFNNSVTGWDQGDFDYSHIVNGIDFGDLAANFNKGVDGSAGLPAYDDPALVAFATANGLLADVPEPASASALALAGAGILARRRRK